MQLTLEQINKLAAMDFPMNGVAPGAEATAEEMEALKLQPDVGPDVSDDASTPEALASLVNNVPTAPVPAAPTMDPTAASAAVGAVPPAAPVTQTQLQPPESGGFFSNTMDTIFGPRGETDQFSNLNRNQRMMLAFGAMRDAGMALQGKDSSAFTDTLKQINAQSDMRRKAQAAEQLRATEASKQAAINQLLGGSRAVGGAATGEAGTVDAKAQLAQLESQMGAFAQMGQMDFYTQKHAQLTKQIEAEAASAEKSAAEVTLKEGKLAGYKDTLRVAESALMAAGKFDSVEDLRKAIEDNSFEGSEFFLTRQSFIPDTKEFKDFTAAANQFAAIMTFQNLGAIVDQGIKLGTLSDADLKIIGNQSGEIDPLNKPRQTAENILQVYRKVGATIKLMERAEEDELQNMINKYLPEGDTG